MDKKNFLSQLTLNEYILFRLDIKNRNCSIIITNNYTRSYLLRKYSFNAINPFFDYV